MTTLAELEVVRPFWEASQRHPEADYEFFRFLVSTRPEILSPCVFALYDGDRPVGLLSGRIEKASISFRLGYLTLFRMSVRQLVLVKGGLMGEGGLDAMRIFLAALDDLLRREHLDRAFFEQTRLASEFPELLQRMFKPWRLLLRGEVYEHRYLRLPNQWDEFLALRSRKHRYRLKNLSVPLDRDFENRWEIREYRRAGAVAEFVAAAESIARRTYHRGMGVGFSASDEMTRRIGMDADRGNLRGYVLWIDGGPAAFWYCTVYARTLHMNATGYCPEYREYEPGTVLLMRLLAAHCGTGIGTVDFGPGDADYKARFASEHYLESPVSLFAATPRGVLLKTVLGTLTGAGSAARRVLNRFRLTGYIRTRWRRRFEAHPQPEREPA